MWGTTSRIELLIDQIDETATKSPHEEAPRTCAQPRESESFKPLVVGLANVRFGTCATGPTCWLTIADHGAIPKVPSAGLAVVRAAVESSVSLGICAQAEIEMCKRNQAETCISLA